MEKVYAIKEKRRDKAAAGRAKDAPAPDTDAAGESIVDDGTYGLYSQRAPGSGKRPNH
jgi:hypothetical protein